jgi:hypothetical protein
MTRKGKLVGMEINQWLPRVESGVGLTVSGHGEHCGVMRTSPKGVLVMVVQLNKFIRNH